MAQHGDFLLGDDAKKELVRLFWARVLDKHVAQVVQRTQDEHSYRSFSEDIALNEDDTLVSIAAEALRYLQRIAQISIVHTSWHNDTCSQMSLDAQRMRSDILKTFVEMRETHVFVEALIDAAILALNYANCLHQAALSTRDKVIRREYFSKVSKALEATKREVKPNTPFTVRNGFMNVVQQLSDVRPSAPDHEAFTNQFEVPGTFELPYACDQLLAFDNCSASIAFGCVVTGETNHAQLISQAAFDQLQRISISRKKPVICGILTCHTQEQLQERAKTKGAECMVSAIRTLLAIPRYSA